MALAFAGVTAVSTVLGAGPIRNVIDQSLFALLPNEPKEVIVLVDLLRRDVIDNAEYENGMLKLGYDSTNAQQILVASRQLLTANELLQHRRQDGQTQVLAFASGAINQTVYDQNIAQLDTDFTTAMKKIGFDSTESTKFRDSNRQIPEFAQFLEFMAKEVFEPAQRTKFGLDDELPDIFVKFAAQFDVNLEEAKNYWASHWNHISPEQVFEIFHRFRTTRSDSNIEGLTTLGLTKPDVEMSFDDVKDYMKLIELPTYWRDRLASITFKPIGLIDLRRLFEEGLLTFDQLTARLKDNGHSDGDSDLLAQMFARRFSSGRRKNLLDNTFELYKINAISRVDAKADLQTIGFSSDEADFQLDKIEQKRDEELIQLRIKALGKRFSKGLVTLANLDAEILTITNNAERTVFIREHLIEEKAKTAPKLTTEQLLKLYEEGHIDEPTLDTRMTDNGFIQADVDLLKLLHPPA